VSLSFPLASGHGFRNFDLYSFCEKTYLANLHSKTRKERGNVSETPGNTVAETGNVSKWMYEVGATAW
jgi:hypothetical protein